jgi:intein/homing endonuclease
MNQRQATPRQPTQEEDIRLQMLNSFLTCSHRDTVELNKFHEELQAKDPTFYSHLASWYQKNGDLRDHKEIFSARLIIDTYLPNREVGLALFQRHPFFLKSKIFNFIKGKDVKIRVKTGKKITLKGKKKPIDEVKIEMKHVGMDKNIPSSFANEIKKYLLWLEKNPTEFDTVAMRNAKDLKALFVSLRLKHSKRTNDILFKKEYPKDSKLSSFKDIINEKDPSKQAEMIVKQKIPFTTAVGLVEEPTPAVWVALIDAMSPQEAINHVATFEEKGLLDNPLTKELIMKKLKKAETSKGVAALKSKTATATGRIKNEEVIKQMDTIADKQIKKSGAIKVSTAICVDKCVVGSSLITTSKGLIPIKSMAPAIYTGAKEISINLEVATREGKAISDKLFLNGKKKVKYLTTYKGYSIGVSLNNPILCYSPDSVSLLWKEAKDINIGDYLVIKRKTECFGEDISFEDYIPKEPYQPNEKVVTLPKKMTPDLARWIGYLVSEGRTRQKVDSITFTNFDEELVKDFIEITKNVFGVDASFEKKGAITVVSSTIVSFMKDALGIKRARARECEVPACILMSSKEVQNGFLKGYFSGDGGLMNRRSGILSAVSASENLIKVIQVMLLNFGIVSRIKIGKSAALNGTKIYRSYWRMFIGGQDSKRFLDTIGFSSKYKEDSIRESVEKGHSVVWSARWDNIPGFSTAAKRILKDKFFELRKFVPRIAASSQSTLNGRIATDLIYKILKEIPSFKEVGDIQEIVDSKFFIDEVVEIKNSEEYVYDIQVPESQSFICNGIISHNSGSMTRAISVGKNCAAIVSGAIEAPLHVMAFDQITYPIVAKEPTMTAWEAAFRPIIAHGRTSMASCVDYLIRKGIVVEQFVYITDEGETDSPTFTDKYAEYKEKFKVSPHVVVIHVDGGEGANYTFTQRLKQAGIAFDTYTPKEADYYSLPGLIPLLARKTKLDLLYEIMDTPLPVRKVYA